MALVAYDYGSGSENEEEEEEEAQSTISEKTPTDKNEENSENQLPGILTQLPKTKQSEPINASEDKLEDFIPKYQPPSKTKKPKVKITIPALSEFDDDEDEPQVKKPKIVSKGSSLLSMLPPVKGSPLSTKSFIPNVLKKKPEKKNLNPNLPQALRKKAEEAKLAKIQKLTENADSDDDIEVPETFDDEMWLKVCGPRSKPKPQAIEEEPVEEIAPVINIAPEPVKPYEGLDNAAFKELVGKAKRPVNIKLIDINEEDVMQDKDILYTKGLTDPDAKAKIVVDEEEEFDPLDPTRKKKHHITYLAEQAKANEQDLQSQWSHNKYARNQTRAKYGF